MDFPVINILKDYGLIDAAQADRLFSLIQANPELPVGRLLINERMLNEKQLYRFICKNLGMNPNFIFSDRNYDIAGLTVPKFSVSGDFYGYFPLDEGRLAITLSDVSGKGLEAGLLAIELADLLKQSIKMKSVIPSTLMRKVNTISKEFFGEEQFATFIILILDMHSGTVEFCCAGSPPILVYRAREKRVEELDVKGIPVGIYSDFLFNGGRCNLATGDILLMYTDGAYEAESIKKQFYGIERIKKNLIRWSSKPTRKILSHFWRDLKIFTLFKGMNDDTTYIAIKKNREV